MGIIIMLLAFQRNIPNIGSFRIDRIVDITEMMVDDAVSMPKDFNLDDFLNSMYHMFSTERKTVELICNNDVMDAIIDRFGKRVRTYACDMENFRVVVKVATNHGFYS